VDRLSVLCFGGTYGLALACDLARFVVRGTARWWATLALTGLAWIVQTAYLGNLAYEKGQLPVATVFESLLVLSWVLAAVALYLIVRSPKPVAVGVFILPVILTLIVIAGFWAPREDWAGSDRGGASYFWGWAHGLLYLVGALASCVAFVAGLMYLAQSDRLKHKRPPRFGFKLPSLEESERLNRGAITVAFPFLTAGLIVGVVTEVALRKAGHSRLGWSDPKVVGGVLVWLVFAGLLHARFQPEMRGRRVMIFTIVAFLCLALATIGVNLMGITSHGVPKKRTQDSGLRTQDSGFRYVGQDHSSDLLCRVRSADRPTVAKAESHGPQSGPYRLSPESSVLSPSNAGGKS
jgi:ABC-type uncharacterized transport system permease subunit